MESIASNQPYDEFAHDVITATAESDILLPPTGKSCVIRRRDGNTTHLLVRFN